jgi:hypothetical protein
MSPNGKSRLDHIESILEKLAERYIKTIEHLEKMVQQQFVTVEHIEKIVGILESLASNQDRMDKRLENFIAAEERWRMAFQASLDQTTENLNALIKLLDDRLVKRRPN